MQVVLVQGTVKFFNDEKGYGFITPDGESKDVFVHFSQIVSDRPGRKSLVNGARVEFELGEGRKGPEAQQVRSV